MYLKRYIICIYLLLPFFVKGQLKGLFSDNIEKTLSDSTSSIKMEKEGTIFITKAKHIVKEINNDQVIYYEYYLDGRKITYEKNGKLNKESVFLDSMKFHCLINFYLEDNPESISIKRYRELYNKIISELDSINYKNIFKIYIGNTIDKPKLDIWYWDGDTIKSTKDEVVVKETINSNTFEYSYYRKNNVLKKRERYENSNIIYSYLKFGDLEIIISYNPLGLLDEFKIKPLLDDYFTVHYSFSYNDRGELVSRLDNLTNEIEHYLYFYGNQ